MQYTNPDPGQDELVRLLLKRQSELNALLEITRAINKNSGTSVLIEMMESVLKNQLSVGKLRLLIVKDDGFACIAKYGGQFEKLPMLIDACAGLKKLRQPSPLLGNPHHLLKDYTYFIPFYDKGVPIAYTLIGDFDPGEEMLYNELSFIQTLVNAIIVALQNKKLVKQRLLTQRIQREMQLASEMQHMLIPMKMYQDDAVEMNAKYLPHQNIGGDYYDFIRINPDEFIWCIADVSGKGISAALLMANFQASLHAWVQVEDDLSDIIQRLNTIIFKNARGEKFITLFLAKYNQQTRKLNYINAGHNPSILYSNGQAVPLKLGTTMIGAFDELPFINQGELTVKPGSLIFNYTDGLLDFDVDNKFWTEEALLEFVKANGNHHPDKFNYLILGHVQREVKGKPIDDITLLTLKVI